jgi:hypothetical protein
MTVSASGQRSQQGVRGARLKVLGLPTPAPHRDAGNGNATHCLGAARMLDSKSFSLQNSFRPEPWGSFWFGPSFNQYRGWA